MEMRVLQGATFIWSRVMEVWLGSPKVNIEETAVLSAAPGPRSSSCAISVASRRSRSPKRNSVLSTN